MTRFCLLCLWIFAAPAVMACPVPSDMSKGVEVLTVSPRGDQTRSVFRKSAQGFVDETRTTQSVFASNTVERRLHHGVFPAHQTLLKSTRDTPLLQDETYSYAEDHITGLRITPGTQFTTRRTLRAADGARRTSEFDISVSRLRFDKVAGCRLKAMRITATEDRDGVKTVFSYQYFPQLGFAVQLKAQHPGETIEQRILSIEPAKR